MKNNYNFLCFNSLENTVNINTLVCLSLFYRRVMFSNGDKCNMNDSHLLFFDEFLFSKYAMRYFITNLLYIHYFT